ncbi:hypothetical protein [uncultured Rummeliibacillus sp.]|uniref:hypothetical protein n=1 Tax=uncultured Rummeliibacillus sp. TaxID=762292 RepID=UPI002611B595|nr:hypothetical protein [uncultured Rummeliibacillus sp.]
MPSTSHYTRLIPVLNKNEVYSIEGTDHFYSEFSTNKNIGKEELLALLSGMALVDISDNEYYHWIQLNEEAVSFANSFLQRKIKKGPSTR